MFERIGCNSQEYIRDLPDDVRTMKEVDENTML